MKDEYNQERLGKIVKLAKGGVGGERANAIKLLKSICEKHNLDFNEVMQDSPIVREYAIPYKKEMYAKLVAQIVYKYCEVHEVGVGKYRKIIYVKTTQEKYIETLNAVDVLVRLYEKERKKLKDVIFFGFLDKHNLYSKPDPDAEYPESTKEEREARMAGSRMAGFMEDAQLLKRLK